MPEGAPTMGEILQAHIDNCGECQSTFKLTPRKLGQQSQMCKAYRDLLQDMAKFEAEASGIKESVVDARKNGIRMMNVKDL